MPTKFDFRPAPPARGLRTMAEVRAWMTDAGCNTMSYHVGEFHREDGYGLREGCGGYAWYFSERGTMTVLETFTQEIDAVAYAVDQMCRDHWACNHAIGFVSNTNDVTRLTSELDARGIPYFQDKIPYGGPNDPRYRVYVHGKFSDMVADLRAQYFRIA